LNLETEFAIAAEWFDLTSNDEPHVKGGQIGKIPTELAYGENAEVVAWGMACKNFADIYDCFKTNFASRKPIISREIEVNKLISDYLYHFCSYVLEEVVREENATHEELAVEWHFTTPGSWNQSIQRDFKMLASKVLHNILPGCKVIVELSEALTSCEFLINELKFPEGTWIISCDIGGATIDTALAIVQDEEVFPIVPTTNQEFSVTNIDFEINGKIKMWLGAYNDKFLTTSRTQHDITKSLAWKNARHAFDASKEVILLIDHHLGNFGSCHDDISVEGCAMRLSR
jgi:hypothetical protein